MRSRHGAANAPRWRGEDPNWTYDSHAQFPRDYGRTNPYEDCAVCLEEYDDGYWSVPGRAISSASNEARLKKVAPIYRYWGTGWATIGLLGTLPDAADGAGPKQQ